jgi:hypothetical protein
VGVRVAASANWEAGEVWSVVIQNSGHRPLAQ